MGSMRTICILGFPMDALPRELKSLCRFLPGFEGAHVAFGGPGGGQITALFVKFATPDLAMSGIDTVNGAPFDLDAPHGGHTLKAELARREMEVRASPLQPPPMAAPAPTAPYKAVPRPAMQPGYATHCGYSAPHGYAAQPRGPCGGHGGHSGFGGHGGHGAVRGPMPHVPAHYAPAPYAQPHAVPHAPPHGTYMPFAGGYAGGEEIVTVAVLSLREKSLSQHELQEWFQQQPGFIKLQLNERIGGMFVKFASRATADQAMRVGNGMQFGVEWARRNLDDDLSSKHVVAAPPPPGPTWCPAPAAGSAPKRPRNYGGEIDTIAVVGMKEKGLAIDDLQQWFRDRPGFVMLQMNERIGSLFVKFETRALAEQAIEDSGTIQIRAEWARRNLDL